MESQNNTTRICPHCGAELASDHADCWLCHNNLPAPSEGDRPPPVPARHAEPAGSGLSSLLLFLLLVVILGGTIAAIPGLGIVMTIIAIPALIRTAIVTMQRRRHGEFVSAGDQAGHFMLTVSIVFASCIAIAITFAIAFLGSCLVTGDRFENLGIWVMAGSLAAVATAVAIIFFLVSLARKRRQTLRGERS
jgi:hypothetical protein